MPPAKPKTAAGSRRPLFHLCLELYPRFSGQDVFIIRQVLFQQSRRIQLIGAPALALAAFQAVFNIQHHLLGIRSQPVGGGAAADELAHSGALGDVDPSRAGQAVAAGPAEIPDELRAVFLNGRLHVRVLHSGGILCVREELVQLLLPLDAPDGQGVLKLGLPGVGCGGVGDEPAGKAFHGDEAHVVLSAQVHQVDVPLGGQIAEGELEGLVEAGAHGLLRHAQAVVGDADVADLPLGLGLLHGLIQAGAVPGLGAEGGVVELVEVDVVGFQKAQAGLQVLPEALCGGGGGLSGDEDFLPHVGEGEAHFLLAVAIGAGGVEEIHSRVVGLAQELSGVLRADPLDGQSAEAVFAGHNSRAAQGYRFHGYSSLWLRYGSKG